MRPPYGNPGQDESTRNINDPRNPDPATSLPARSSMQVFAQQSGSFPASQQYPDLFSPSSPKSNPQFYSHSVTRENKNEFKNEHDDQRAFYTYRRNRSSTFVASASHNAYKNTGHISNAFDAASAAPRAFTASAVPADYAAPATRAVPDAPAAHAAYATPAAHAVPAPHGTFRVAPESAIPVQRAPRVPAGYMPYTQTTNMGKGASITSGSVPRRTVAPINDMDDGHPSYAMPQSTDASGVITQTFNAASAHNGTFIKTDIETNAAGLGLLSRTVNPQQDPYMKNLKYGEYLIVPEGSKAIFANTSGPLSRLPLFMIATLGILFVILLVVWGFAV